ncbi:MULTISPECIES: cytochrome c [Caulobacter]|jgi:mono/diheme cytochrome c family protein|uniref:c-type cytochrome n=1 Tax=Caulobacter TaxID=75 RepID=UPI0009E6ECDA|nr:MULTISPECIES: cytochrome c [Caulobacter]ATC24372.1 cytochrome c [Caulobacter vibrioides]MBQ1561713.1 cytochrome c [Caulobacter sp.]MCK5909032.1 cytochrome c [Caulobacter sp.]PIB97085.1 cytochrome C [Caulobacter sp. X]
MKLFGWNLAHPRTHLGIALVLGVAALLAALIAGVTIGLGVYNIGADAPHTRPVYALLETLRNRSISVRAASIQPPDNLSDPKRIASGAGLYTQMCSGCHLGPGLEKTEMSWGLYPQAAELWRTTGRPPGEQFWVIKHGIKMTAMPAWGRTHSDALVWDMVAFVRQLPSMSPEQYLAATQNAPADHDAVMKEGGDMKGMPGMKDMKAVPDMKDMPGMTTPAPSKVPVGREP